MKITAIFVFRNNCATPILPFEVALKNIQYPISLNKTPKKILTKVYAIDKFDSEIAESITVEFGFDVSDIPELFKGIEDKNRIIKEESPKKPENSIERTPNSMGFAS